MKYCKRSPRRGGTASRCAQDRRGLLVIGLFAALTLAVVTAGQAMAAAFTVTDLGTLGGSFSVARGINDLGQVVGYSATAGGATHAFLWQSGTMIDLGTLNPAGGDSYASGINNLGEVVGTSTSDFIDEDSGFGSNLPHAFLWQNGSMADLHRPYFGSVIAHESDAIG